MIKDSRIAEYPDRAITLNKFLGSKVELLIDGAFCPAHRLHVVFPTEADLREAIIKLVRVSISNREDALNFMLGVLDEYKETIG
jgi:hypothetical protein